MCLLITLIFLSLFSFIFIGGLPYPTTLIMLMGVTNGMVVFYSLIFHPIAVGLYNANVYPTSDSITGYIFKYVAIFSSGLNYHARMTLGRMPLW
ncbi:hypothetical protein [Virgibacillus pantothenticus]|uniref:hypothetical protein n=1 Tax=Virgibacillus pantothenticus TaxID=1473 RepID=UPI0009546F5A|nr:hypothetical protein [Virgibacillus pantothenticus]SIT05255.1 hypothetical protein SAMN05421787_11268 [Virgibacillus pantothenticus]